MLAKVLRNTDTLGSLSKIVSHLILLLFTVQFTLHTFTNVPVAIYSIVLTGTLYCVVKTATKDL